MSRTARVVLLGFAAALAAVLAIALAQGHEERAAPLPEPGAMWYTALAGVRPPARVGRTTACGIAAGPRVEGVAHGVLPCGTRIYVSFGSRTALTEVVDRMANEAPRELDLTAALAERLGVHGTAQVRWTYAREG